jgi:ribosomal protein S18 acetylase RimI-like enzyme
VLALQRTWASERITHGYVPSAEQDLLSQLGPYFVVAQAGNRIVGFVCGHEELDQGSAVTQGGNRCLHMNELYVLPDYRGQGVGSSLVELVLDAAKKRGVKHCLVYSATNDHDAVLRFYRRHKFNTWYVQLWRDL